MVKVAGFAHSLTETPWPSTLHVPASEIVVLVHSCALSRERGSTLFVSREVGGIVVGHEFEEIRFLDLLLSFTACVALVGTELTFVSPISGLLPYCTSTLIDKE